MIRRDPTDPPALGDALSRKHFCGREAEGKVEGRTEGRSARRVVLTVNVKHRPRCVDSAGGGRPGRPSPQCARGGGGPGRWPGSTGDALGRRKRVIQMWEGPKIISVKPPTQSSDKEQHPMQGTRGLSFLTVLGFKDVPVEFYKGCRGRGRSACGRMTRQERSTLWRICILCA